MGEMRNAYSILVGKPEGKRPLGRPACIWEHTITMDLREIRCEGVSRMHWLSTGTSGGGGGAFVNTVMNIRVPYNA
jgi:hypothetical protein